VLDERGLTKLRPMYGPRPLDTYTMKVVHERDKRGKPTGKGKVVAIVDDCPCRGAIPYGSPMVCEVCGRSGVDDKLEHLMKLQKRREKYAERKEGDVDTQDNDSDQPDATQ
jgi:hypothetical protein